MEQQVLRRLTTRSGYACSIISTVLQQCGTTDPYSYYHWQIAIVIFLYIDYWLLLVVIVYSLNTMLRQQLDHPTAISKIVPAAIVGLMGPLTGAVAGLRAYILWAQTNRINWFSRWDLYSLVEAQQKLQAAYYSLYLVSLLASGGLALMTIMSLRSTRKAAGVSSNINTQLLHNTNIGKGFDWLGHCSHYRHGVLGHHSDCLHCVVLPGHRLYNGGFHRLELPCKLRASPQLHLHPLHCKARIVA
jgi:hypothetical protein